MDGAVTENDCAVLLYDINDPLGINPPNCCPVEKLEGINEPLIPSEEVESLNKSLTPSEIVFFSRLVLSPTWLCTIGFAGVRTGGLVGATAGLIKEVAGARDGSGGGGGRLLLFSIDRST